MDINTLSTGLNGFGHPVRLCCLVLLETERSPSELFEILRQTEIPPSLGTVSYHMRMLKQYDLVYEVRTEPRRGALEHFYRRTENADLILKAVAKLVGTEGLPKRGPGRPSLNGKRNTDLLAALGALPDLEAIAA